jgi:hypothetical protein
VLVNHALCQYKYHDTVQHRCGGIVFGGADFAYLLPLVTDSKTMARDGSSPANSRGDLVGHAHSQGREGSASCGASMTETLEPVRERRALAAACHTHRVPPEQRTPTAAQ